jgi:hypothetical protein
MADKLNTYDLLAIFVPGVLPCAWIPICFPAAATLPGVQFPAAFTTIALTALAIFLGQWYVSERNRIAQYYPQFRVDEGLLSQGILCYYGELLVRPSGGTKRHPVQLLYPEATPFDLPIVTPLKSLPQFNDKGAVQERPVPDFSDHRHQMPKGTLCLFQRETRAVQTERGYWWSLPNEPKPFRDGVGLLRELCCVAPNGDAWQMLNDTLGRPTFDSFVDSPAA